MEKTSSKEAMKELTMMLMYLSRITEERDFKKAEDFYAWKNYDFDTVDLLESEEYIHQGRKSSKRVYLTEDGKAYAKALLKKYEIADWY